MAPRYSSAQPNLRNLALPDVAYGTHGRQVLDFYQAETQEPAKDPPHSANLCVGLAEKLRKEGLPFELNYTGATDVAHPDLFSFLPEHLRPENH